MRLSIFGTAFVAASLVSAAAFADAPTFGKSGQLAITWDQALATMYPGVSGGGASPGLGGPGSWSMVDFQYASVSNNGGSGTHFGIAPDAAYFVIDNLSVGGQVLLSIGSYSPSGGGQGTGYTAWGIAPQVGYNIGITDNISFWPKLSFSYSSSSVNNNGPTYSQAGLGIFAPFLYHPTNHFFLGAGPDLGLQLSSSASQNGVSVDQGKITSFGIMATFGGYFLGD